MKKSLNRRQFIKAFLATAVTASPLVSAIRQSGSAMAVTIGNDYKAIVCILLEGGADAFNMVVPRSGVSYNAYSTVRENMALAASSLLPITPGSYSDGVAYGFHPTMTRMQGLFSDQKLAVIANVGTLVQPVTRTEVENGAPVPNQWFAHNTQRDLWMTANAAQAEQAGWAARLADIFDPGQELFNITVGGKNLMQRGGNHPAFEFSGDDIYAFDDYYAFRDDGKLGEVYRQLLTQNANHENLLVGSFAKERQRGIRLAGDLSQVFDNATSFTFPDGVHESGTQLGDQLAAVAKMLSVKDALPGRPRRQIFFINYHDWDTHATPLDAESHKVDYLDKCLGTFADALAQLGLENNVTTCTISDFGRSITPNGAGTDHGWGSHAFVMGGAVNGGDIYGLMPKIEADSPDAIEDRVIPTTAVDQYLATIAAWFGASTADLGAIFPNLHSFPTTNLGFLG
ncbi:MAG TPA: DUF1501 domain-containing protein [Desulfobulbaceae bacterium]|nr:DUF1501 domain-containing protein [Desulfobulbaceae bacterium]